MSAPELPDIELSVVAPVLNEVEVIEELVARCRAAAAQVTDAWELVIVDDHSDDGTGDRLAAMADGAQVRHLRLPANVGQFRATLEGLAASRGRHVVVLDGDLQDPPEHIVDLARLLRTHDEDRLVVFAVKTSREASLLFRAARMGYSVLSQLAVWRVPPGAGSYCGMSGPVAQRIAEVRAPWANLAPFVAAAGDRVLAVPYRKAARYDGRSRVGALGLVLEGFSTLTFNGGVERMCLVLSVGFLALGRWPLAIGWVCAALIFGLKRSRLERSLRRSD